MASTPRPSRPGSSPRPVPIWARRSWAPSARFPGPLHGGAPSRALDMLDAIGTADRAEAYIRRAIEDGERIMGFGHRVYKTDDPRSLLLRSVSTERLGGPLVAFSQDVERTTVDVLAELKPGPPALHQRRVLCRGGDAHLRHPPPHVHPHLRRRADDRLEHARDGAGVAQPPHPPCRPLRRSAPAATGARRFIALDRRPGRALTGASQCRLIMTRQYVVWLRPGQGDHEPDRDNLEELPAVWPRSSPSPTRSTRYRPGWWPAAWS